jgi:hypothetical protein
MLSIGNNRLNFRDIVRTTSYDLLNLITSMNAGNGVCIIGSQIAKECKACIAQGRTAQLSGKRIVMQELSVNYVRIEEDGKK